MSQHGGRPAEGGARGLLGELPVWLAAAALALLPFVRGLAQGHCLFFRDLARYFFPTRHFLTEGLQHGQLRLWNPFVYEGFSEQPLMLYPFDLPQLLRNDEWTYSLLLALHVALGAAGLAALVRTFGGSRLAAIGGGALYALSGYGLSLVNLDTALRAYAWAPLMVLTLRRAATGGRRSVAVAGLTCGVALSTLIPEILLQVVLLALLISCWPCDWRRVTRVLAALALAGGWAATPLLLQARLIPGSARGALLETSQSLTEGIQPVAWLQLGVANLFGDLAHLGQTWWGFRHFDGGFPYMLSLYLGPVTLALALAGCVAAPWFRKRLLVALLIGVVVCTGSQLALGGLLHHLPIARLFRYPVKAFFTVQLAVTLLAAGGLAALASQRRAAWRAFLVGASALAAVLLAARGLWVLRPALVLPCFDGFFLAGTALEQQRASIDLILRDAALGGAAALVTAVVAALALRDRLGASLAAALVAALMVADLLRAGAGLNPMVTPDYFQLSEEAQRIYRPIARDGGRLFTCEILAQRHYAAARRAMRVRDESFTFAATMESGLPHGNVAFGIPTALSIDLSSLVPVERARRADEPNCEVFEQLEDRLRLAGVTHVVSADPLTSPSLRLLASLRPERIAPLALHVYQLAEPLPRVAVAAEVHVARSAAEARDAALLRGLVARGGVTVEAPAPPRGASGSATLTEDLPGRLRCAVQSQGPALLVIREGFDPAWQALVDGKPAPVWRANGRHLSVPVPAGASVVTLRHRPWQLTLGLALGALAALTTCALLWARPARRA